jgi:hypothetical protein
MYNWLTGGRKITHNAALRELYCNAQYLLLYELQATNYALNPRFGD